MLDEMFEDEMAGVKTGAAADEKPFSLSSLKFCHICDYSHQ